MLSEWLSFFREEISQQPIHHVRGLWLSWVDPARQEDGFLLAVVSQVLHQSSTESNKVGTCLQEMIFIILEELLDFFFCGCLKEPLYSPFGLLALLGKFLGI